MSSRAIALVVEGEAFRVYSIGANRRDDGGHDFQTTDRDDLCFAVPPLDDEAGPAARP